MLLRPLSTLVAKGKFDLCQGRDDCRTFFRLVVRPSNNFLEFLPESHVDQQGSNGTQTLEAMLGKSGLLDVGYGIIEIRFRHVPPYNSCPRNSWTSWPGLNSPMRLISHCRRMPEFTSTRARTVSPRYSRS